MGINSPTPEPEKSAAGSEKERLAAATRHDLPENATWDQINAAGSEVIRNKVDDVLNQ